MRASAVKGVILGTAVGIACGIGAYTFIYAKGASYLTDNPEACTNCHIMDDQYDGWINSSHRSVATCNDCHTPPGLIPKYYTKAQNGFWHSFYFTTGNHPDPIRITERNREVTEQACRKCHGDIVETIEGHNSRKDDRTSCIRCHRSVGHLH